MALTKVPSNLDATIATTQSASDNSTNVATTAYVTTAIANLVDGAPSTLNTLDEIAAALNDDAALNTTLTNAIATKMPLAGGTFTGAVNITKETPYLNLTDSSSSRTLGVFVDDNNSVLRSSGQLLLQIGSQSAITIDSGKRVGVNQVPAANNFALQVQGIQTDGSDGRVAYFKGYGTQTSIGSTGPSVVIQNANNTANNYTKLSFESAGAGETVSINSQNIDHTNHYGDMAFNTRGSGGYSEKARIKANGHLEFNPVNSFAALNNSILSSSNTYLYMMGGAAGLYLANNSGLDTSIGIRDANYIDFNVSSDEKMRLTSAGNLGIGEDNPAATLHVEHSSGTAYNGASEILESAIISNKNGTDGSGVNNVASIGLHVADGATSQGFINYVRTGDNTGKFTFSQRVASGTYRENFRIENDKTYSLYPILQGGVSSSVGIGSTMADVNGAELGPGYLNLARDDTADAKQISFSKNGVRVSDISTTDKGILWEVLESSGNAAAFQVTNGVGHSVWSTMNAQGHKWQDNVYNAFSAGGVSIGTDSSNTSHMWWNTYDTGSKHGVSAGYGMDQYVSVSNGDWVTRFSDNSGFIGDGVTLSPQFTVKRTGHTHVGQSTSDVLLYVGSAGTAFGGNSSNWMRAAGSTLMFNSAGSTMNFEIQGSQKGYLNSSGWQNGSDRSLKENIEDITYGLDTVKLLRPRKFDWIDAPDETKNSIGFIAQEVETVIPEIISEAGTTPKKGMNYGVLTSVLVKAIQEQQTIIEDLKSRIETLEG